MNTDFRTFCDNNFLKSYQLPDLRPISPKYVIGKCLWLTL